LHPSRPLPRVAPITRRTEAEGLGPAQRGLLGALGAERALATRTPPAEMVSEGLIAAKTPVPVDVDWSGRGESVLPTRGFTGPEPKIDLGISEEDKIKAKIAGNLAKERIAAREAAAARKAAGAVTPTAGVPPPLTDGVTPPVAARAQVDEAKDLDVSKYREIHDLLDTTTTNILSDDDINKIVEGQAAKERAVVTPVANGDSIEADDIDALMAQTKPEAEDTVFGLPRQVVATLGLGLLADPGEKRDKFGGMMQAIGRSGLRAAKVSREVLAASAKKAEAEAGRESSERIAAGRSEAVLEGARITARATRGAEKLRSRTLLVSEREKLKFERKKLQVELLKAKDTYKSNMRSHMVRIRAAEILAKGRLSAANATARAKAEIKEKDVKAKMELNWRANAARVLSKQTWVNFNVRRLIHNYPKAKTSKVLSGRDYTRSRIRVVLKSKTAVLLNQGQSPRDANEKILGKWIKYLKDGDTMIKDLYLPFYEKRNMLDPNSMAFLNKMLIQMYDDNEKGKLPTK